MFSKNNVKNISDQMFRYGEYDGSDFDSDASIYYEEGHGIEYHENDKPEIKKQIKKKLKIKNY